ncbi:MAG TPA: arylesterase [Vicinamibacterales bacterium]|nr:arylesterase [Vicinamibacterales bacterium]
MIFWSLLLAVASAAVVPQPRPRIVAFGDSLTSGKGIGTAQAFPAILQQRIEKDGLEYSVVNAGMSGDTSTRAMHRFDAAMEGDVRVLILALGANDGLRGAPVAQVKANLSEMIEKAQRRGITVLLCAMEALPIYGWDYTVAFHKMYQDLAKKYDVTLVPFILMNVIGDPGLMQPDHAHPNAAGARAIADTIWPYLEPILQKNATPTPAR